MSILSDIYRRYSPVISQAVTTCVRLPSCPGYSRVRQGWRRRFRVTQQSANENRTKFDYCNFPKSSRSGNFFPGNGKFFRDPGKSSPVNIPSPSNFWLVQIAHKLVAQCIWRTIRRRRSITGSSFVELGLLNAERLAVLFLYIFSARLM